jgi:hypothetical protein
MGLPELSVAEWENQLPKLQPPPSDESPSPPELSPGPRLERRVGSCGARRYRAASAQQTMITDGIQTLVILALEHNFALQQETTRLLFVAEHRRAVH